MTDPAPRFSVVVPTFNRAQSIDKTIDSVQKQTVTNWELLIVDDGSTDETERILGERIAADPRIKVIKREQNSGLPGVARNTGLAEARGDLIAFLDSDDYWWPRHLEFHARAHEGMQFSGLCYSHLWCRRARRPFFGLLFLPSPYQQATSRQRLLKRNTIQCSAVSVPRSLLTTVGGFDESPDLAAVEDYELWLRCASVGDLAFIPRITGTYTSSGGISATQDMERQLSNLSRTLDEPVGRRTSLIAALERVWGIPAALLSFGLAELRDSPRRD